MCKPTTSTSTFDIDGIPEQLFGCSKPAVTPGILTCEDLEQSTVSDGNEVSVTQRHCTQGPGVSDLGNGQPNSANDDAKIAIIDHEKKRTFVQCKESMPDVVLWNPWDKKAKALPDLGDEDYKTMLCVDSATIETPISVATL
ncbi:hypothetical protein F0562_007465 [Nyssa sinensis]|uniref:Glucose-6-phosphate 1-epimerase n=1 Tax=Nyssa sinensis TaxID=561372 RepID=A0A5J5A462_9ASTE|nr:hypothetical protein F0562_007465 [Nyssa sinensis]